MVLVTVVKMVVTPVINKKERQEYHCLIWELSFFNFTGMCVSTNTITLEGETKA